MKWPAFWWLLLPALIGHGLFFLTIGALRLQKKTLQDAPWAVVVFAASVVSGLFYGAVQHDVVLMVAELFLTAIVYRYWRSR